jgi:hypothetical protein
VRPFIGGMAASSSRVEFSFLVYTISKNAIARGMTNPA